MKGVSLDSRELWGSEAADDENPEILASYFVYQPTFAQFFDHRTRYSICRASKGMGKSALLRQCLHEVSRTGSDTIAILLSASDLIAQKRTDASTPDEHIHAWQQRLCAVIIRHLGQHIGVALTDDAITMVEAAELAGYKERNL